MEPGRRCRSGWVPPAGVRFQAKPFHMQIQVFSIAMDGDGNSMEELNVFLRTHRVLSVDKVAVMDQGRHYWSVYVEYLVRKGAQGGGLTSGSGGLSNRPRVDYVVLAVDGHDGDVDGGELGGQDQALQSTPCSPPRPTWLPPALPKLPAWNSFHEKPPSCQGTPSGFLRSCLLS